MCTRYPSLLDHGLILLGRDANNERQDTERGGEREYRLETRETRKEREGERERFKLREIAKPTCFDGGVVES
jgi:hypothetical protein